MNIINSKCRTRSIVLLTTLLLGSINCAAADKTDLELLEILKSKGTLTKEEFDKLNQSLNADKQPIVSFNDGLKVSTADGQNSIHIGGRVQADYRQFSGDDAQNADTFDIRRTYLQAGGKMYGRHDFLVVGNFSGSSASLVYAYLNTKVSNTASVQIGQFKMPMGLEELTSSRFSNFQERSLPMQFVPAIDRGIMIHGAPSKGLYYAISASNGSGANTTEADNKNDSKDITGRLAVNFADIFESKDAIYHFATSFGQGEISTAKSGLKASTEAKGVTFFQVADFTGDDVDRQRFGLEMALAFGPAKIQSEYVKNEFDGQSSAGLSFDRSLESQYIALNWMITGENYAGSYKGYKFDRMKPTKNVGNGSWGAWELGARFSSLDASDFTSGNSAGTGVLTAGTANKADAFTLGLKWILDPNTRVLANYVHTKFDSPVTHSNGASDDEKAFTVRAQIDF